MPLHETIFSDQRRFRVTRHILFWMSWILFASVVQLTGPGIIELTWNERLGYQIIRSANRVLPQIFFCYATVYFVVPRFIPKRQFVQLAVSIAALFILTVALTYLWFSFSGGLATRMYLAGHTFGPFTKRFYSFYSNINFTGALPVTCLMLIAKSYKSWHNKQIETEILQRENIHAELQLLKSQVHPHFLFNTLNNIYSFAYSGSPVAAELVDKLSGMMNYMSTEGAMPLVPLEKEILLIRDYLGLEKVRYGDRLNIREEITGNPHNKLIAPLLMIPFLENCFKHGASAMRGKQWIELNINVTQHELDFRLSNSKPPGPVNQNGKKGIGLANVQKRLQLLYPEKHFLKMESEPDTFRVYLKVTLTEEAGLPLQETKYKKQQGAYYE